MERSRFTAHLSSGLGHRSLGRPLKALDGRTAHRTFGHGPPARGAAPFLAVSLYAPGLHILHSYRAVELSNCSLDHPVTVLKGTEPTGGAVAKSPTLFS